MRRLFRRTSSFLAVSAALAAPLPAMAQDTAPSVLNDPALTDLDPDCMAVITLLEQTPGTDIANMPDTQLEALEPGSRDCVLAVQDLLGVSPAPVPGEEATLPVEQEESEAEAAAETEAESEIVTPEGQAEALTETDDVPPAEGEADEQAAESEAAPEAEGTAEDAAAAEESAQEVPAQAEAEAPAEDATPEEPAEMAESEPSEGAEPPAAEPALEVAQEDTELATEAANAQVSAEAAAASEDAAAAPEDAAVETEVVTEETARSSDEEFEEAANKKKKSSKKKNARAESLTTSSAEAREDDDSGLNLGQIAAGVIGGLVLGDILRPDEEVVQNTGDRVVVQRPDGEYYVVKDENALLRRPGVELQTQTFSDGSTRQIANRPDGSRVETIRAANGQVLRRVKYTPDGTRIVLFDDTAEIEPVDVSRLPTPAVGTLDPAALEEDALRQALAAEEARASGRRFSLAQIRNIRAVRDLVPTIELQDVTFDTGSAAIRPSEAEELAAIGRGMRDLIGENPYEVFLIEGHTDAVGSAAMNLALSDRRAESVALALTEYFDVPPENMVVQGYGESNLRVPTPDAERLNRRAAVRRITPLLQTAAAN